MKMNRQILKDKIQNRINQIRRSYPYQDLNQKPGLSVATLAGDPNDTNKFTPSNIEDMSDYSKLAII